MAAEKRFEAVESVARLLDIIGTIALFGGGLVVMLGVANWGEGQGGMLLIFGAILAVMGLLIAAVGQLIKVFIAIEENTRMTEENTRKQKA